MTKHKSHDERREQILRAARTCFIRNGYAHTRVDDIAVEADLSKGGIYFHFKSKREIFDALLEAQQGRTQGLLEEVGQIDGSAAEKLGALAQRLVRAFSEIEDRRKFLIVLAEMGMRDEQLMQRVRDAHERYLAAILDIVRAGQQSGEFRTTDAEGTALFLKMVMDGVEQALALGYEIDVGKLFGAGMDVILGGMLSRPA